MTVCIFAPQNLRSTNSGESYTEVEAVSRKVRSRDESVHFIDLSKWPSGVPIEAHPSGQYSIDGDEAKPNDLSAGFVFPPALFGPLQCKGIDVGDSPPSDVVFQFREFRAVFTGLLHVLRDVGVKLSCPPERFRLHQLGLWRAAELERRGIPTVDSIVTNEPERVRDFCKEVGEVAINTSGADSRVAEGGIAASEVDDFADRIQNSPVLIREHPDGVHQRAFVVAGDVVGMVRRAGEDSVLPPVLEEDTGVEPTDFSSSAGALAVDVADSFDLPIAIVDLHQRSDGDYEVFDVASSGRFKGADEALDGQVSEAIAEWLVDE